MAKRLNIRYGAAIIHREPAADIQCADPQEDDTDIFYPMTDTVANSVSAKSGDGNNVEDCTVVGIFSVIFYWRDMLKDILPPESDGIAAVIENACNQSFTYEVNGPDAKF